MKIAVDIGHNCAPDTGAVAIGNENVMVMDVGRRVISKLRALGHNVLLVTPTDCSSVSNSLWQRVSSANGWGAELYVSLHENAGGGHGVEVWIGSERSRAIAQNIVNNIAALGFRNRGVKVQGKDGPHLYVLNNTIMPALLVEGAFVDSAEDMRRFNAEDMANAIVQGITGQTISGVSLSTEPSTPATAGGGTTSSTTDESTRRLQEYLNSLVNAGITVDGIYGSATRAAVARFQNIMGLTADGIAGSNTWNAIKAVLARPLSRVGSRGYAVRWIQWRVGAAVDGIFGNGTRQKVEVFQGNRGLNPDGIVGNLTWQQMFK